MRAHQPERLGHDFIQDPHTLYERLRVEGPAHPIIMWGGLRAWLVTGYVEAKALLTDPRLGKDHFRALRLFPPGTAGPHASPLAANMLHADPPDHTRLRRLVNKAFAVRAVAHLRTRIELIADELLQNVDTTSSVDLMQSFALPLPIRVISSLLGVPKADRDKFADWTEPFIGNASPDKLQWAHNELAAYLGALIAAKRVEPTDDLLTELVRTSEDGDRLSEQELLAMAFLLIMAGSWPHCARTQH